MDPMVVKYVGLSGIVYGLHGLLAAAQIALGLFLLANGRILLSDKKKLGKWATRLGLMANERLSQKPLNGWLMIATGAALIFPIFGLPHWFAVVACPIAIYWIMALRRDTFTTETRKSGNWAQKGLIAGSVLVFGFTLWEGKDLVRSAAVVTYKAAYYQMTEVQGWQKTNNPNVPQVGELAPDFELTDVHGEKTVRLSDFRGKRPVVLLFGSFT
jgi:hypothetical protein